MHWADSIAKALSHRGDKHVIASGITPSGEFHIGHLREILTSDIIKRACITLELDVEFVFFVDDADPLRKVYSFLDNSYEAYIGHQLANIPPPDENGIPDLERFEQGISYAQHFLEPFKKSLQMLGVEIDQYIYNYDAYKSEKFSVVSRTACNRADEIREIIERVSGRELDSNWFPWNPIDAKGCMDGITITGWEDPFVHWLDSDGNAGQSDVTKGEGKLPWRIDWPAKWAWRGVTMEPFGKDHGAAGGSYDTGKEIVRLFDVEPPYPTTYEWISLKGAGAMSSSTGVTIGPLEALRLVPPQIMRYLITRNQPKRHIDFDTGNALIELADEYQRNLAETMRENDDGWWGELSRRQQKAWKDMVSRIGYAQINSDISSAISGFAQKIDNSDTTAYLDNQYFGLSKITFRHLALLAQLRENDDAVWESVRRSGLIHEIHGGPTENEVHRLELMRNWIASPHFPDGFRLRIQTQISELAKENMDSRDVDYIRDLVGAFSDCDWDWATINNHVCELAKEREMKLRDAFQLMYWIVLDQDFGPKLASILEEMDRKAVLSLLQSAIDELSA
ncbi:MAG: lysine--tRNA ligase [Marine Group II euryarchaeote MED-G33]|nr:MAG: lysine--tRNA ligase [Marine Group II euryarchaeote MED-G33]|tara:strand:- start:155 stop:1849 length:1695 start_codon:yes stop_codon:yes gene_type:complete